MSVLRHAGTVKGQRGISHSLRFFVHLSPSQRAPHCSLIGSFLWPNYRRDSCIDRSLASFAPLIPRSESLHNSHRPLLLLYPLARPFNASFYLTDMHILASFASFYIVFFVPNISREGLEENLNLMYQTSFWDIVFFQTFLLRVNSIRAIEIKLLLVQIRFSLDRLTFESI